jgi:phospholipase/lecithinase/hemolysin
VNSGQLSFRWYSGFMNLRRVVCIALVAVSSLGWSFDRVVVFGDSLSDTGNTNNATFGLFPGAEYWNGRFSNGPVWVESFATALGGSATRSSAGGLNFAYGGAEADTGAVLSTLFMPNIGTQIGSYQSSQGTFGADDLVVLWAGGNDFAIRGETDPLKVANDMAAHMSTLYGLGARKFLLPNLPELGYVPRFMGTGDEAAMNARSVEFNSALAGHAAALRSQPGAIVFELDIASLFADARSNPGAYGISNISQSYLDTGGDVNQFMFFDDLHPTQQIHSAISQRALESVPEPVSMVGLAVFGALVARRRVSK